MSARRLLTWRVLRWVLLAVALLAIGLYVVLPIGLGVYAVSPSHGAVGAPPDGAREVKVETSDGLSLAGWYAPPENGAAIILLHGASESRENVRDHMTLLTGHGYGVLALDMRGHGESEGDANRLGWDGTNDVAAAVSFLGGQPEVARIGGLGLSMGGEVLLGAAGDVPEVRAIVADGATRRSLDDLVALPSEQPLYRNLTARIMFATVEILSEADQPRPLLESMKAATDTEFLLIAAGAEGSEVSFDEFYAREVDGRVELWVAPDTTHTAALRTLPREYESRVVAFFDSTLGG